MQNELKSLLSSLKQYSIQNMPSKYHVQLLTEHGLLKALWYGATGLAKSNFTLDSYQTESMLKSAMTN